MKKNNTEILKETPVQVSLVRIFQSFFALGVMLLLIFITVPDKNAKIMLFLIGVLVGGWPFIIEAIESVFQKHKINIDVLMVLAIFGAGFLEQYDEGMTIVFLYSISETLETYTIKWTRSTMKSLAKLVPETVTLIDNDIEIEKNVELLRENDVFLLRPGDYCPTDGVIIHGTAFINESSVTGESVPVNKHKGDPIFAGTVCLDGFIKVKVTRPVSESTIAKIIKAVEEAQEKKTPIQLLVDKFTRIYNPLIIVLAFLVFIVPSLVFGDFYRWATFSITFLVASAPCALAISTPVAIFAAVGSAGKKGILVKGGVYLERLGEIEGIAFDKTGTLTFGEPVLTQVLIKNKSYSMKNVIQHAATLETASKHPLAKAVLNKANENKYNLLQAYNINTLPGKGIKGGINGKTWFFGSPDFENNDDLLELKDNSSSISVLSCEGKILAYFVFEDQIRNETKEIIDYLNQNNINTYMLTGDHKNAAFWVAQQLGMKHDHIFYSLLPEQKSDTILELKKKQKLAMIGDGINDAIALTKADLGIAMGTVGTDVTLQSADIAIMSDSFISLKSGILIGKRMKAIIFQNIILSTLIIGIVLSGVLAGVINLSLAILFHEGSEIIIIGNSLRLFRFKSKTLSP